MDVLQVSEGMVPLGFLPPGTQPFTCLLGVLLRIAAKVDDGVVAKSHPVGFGQSGQDACVPAHVLPELLPVEREIVGVAEQMVHPHGRFGFALLPQQRQALLR